MTEREQFEAWARDNGLIYESHGLLSVSSSLELLWKVWQAARAQPAQAGAEPVAWMDPETKVLYDHDTSEVDKFHGFAPTVPLYTRPPARVPLTDEWIRERCQQTWVFETVNRWVREVEAAHGIGGGK